MKNFLLSILIIISISACGMKTGEEAIALMTQQQVEIVDDLKRLSSITTKEQLIGMWGEPDTNGVGGVNPKWKLNNDGAACQVTAYFISGELQKIQMISVDPMWGYSAYFDSNGFTHSI